MGPTAEITPEEAERAIYIDFEGRRDREPVLLGVLYAEGRRRIDHSRLVLRHDLVDRRYRPLLRAFSELGEPSVHRYDTDQRSLDRSIEGILQRAEHQDRLIVAWSQHELDVVWSACRNADFVEAFGARFRDGKATAKRWLRETSPDSWPQREPVGGAHKLAYYCRLVGFDVPAEFGPGVVGTGLKIIDQALDTGRSWAGFTDRQREAWRRVLGHNLFDCLGLRAVVTAATSRRSLCDY